MTDTEKEFKYAPHDLGWHPVVIDDRTPPVLQDILEWHATQRGGPMIAAEMIMHATAIGYGGHYDEVTEQSQEFDVLSALAEYLAPKYNMDGDEAYFLLTQVRDEFCFRLRAAKQVVAERWRNEGYVVDLRPSSCDHCPMCGRRILDHDEIGCEAPDGQRWCIEHALETLARLRVTILQEQGVLE